MRNRFSLQPKDYVEDYICTMYEAGCSASEIQEQYEWDHMNVKTNYIVDRMEKKYQDKFWELDEDGYEDKDLSEYADAVLHNYADEMMSELEDEDDDEE